MTKIALLNEQGDYEGVEDAVFETRAIKYKNSVLVPMYSRIKGLIRHLKASEENKLMQDYEHGQAHIVNSYRGQEQKDKLEKLSAIYHKLLLALRKEAMQPANLIKELNRKFLIFFNVLQQWKAYTDVVGRSSSEIMHELSQQETQEEYKQHQFLYRQMDYSSPEERLTSEEEAESEEFDIERLKLTMRKELAKLQGGSEGQEMGAEDKDMTLR